VRRKSPLECIIASTELRPNLQKRLKVRAQGKKFFFYTSAVETNSFHMAGHIKDDTDLIRILDHD
jgi:hypothetical protein